MVILILVHSSLTYISSCQLSWAIVPLVEKPEVSMTTIFSTFYYIKKRKNEIKLKSYDDRIVSVFL